MFPGVGGLVRRRRRVRGERGRKPQPKLLCVLGGAATGLVFSVPVLQMFL